MTTTPTLRKKQLYSCCNIVDIVTGSPIIIHDIAFRKNIKWCNPLTWFKKTCIVIFTYLGDDE